MRVLLFSLLAIIAFPSCANPCDEVDRSLDQNRKTQLESVIAKQLNITSADIIRSFKYQDWQIIFAETHVSDETYLFFKGDPIHEKYITLWSGAAKADEEQQINDWTIKNAEGIPTVLAACFAWHVTKWPSLSQSLNRFLQVWDDGKDKTMRYVATFSDLNGDGIPEAIVYLKFSSWCGSGGCNSLILKQDGASWKIVTNKTITRPPIRILSSTSNGWHDIGVWTQGGGIQPGYESVLRFNGKTYRNLPHPSQQSLDRPVGEEVITTNTAQVSLYR